MPLKNKQPSGRYCAVINCSSNQGKLKLWGNELCEIHGQFRFNCCTSRPYKLHRFPKDPIKRQIWTQSMKRERFTANDNSLVCSLHFVDGKPTKEHPNPELNLGYAAKRAKKRPAPKVRQPLPPKKPREDLSMGICVIEEIASNEKDCQTEIFTRTISTQVNFSEFTFSNLPEKKVKFYTGLNLIMFMTIASAFKRSLEGSATAGLLAAEDQLLVLARLRLNLKLTDLAYRFKITLPNCSKIFSAAIVRLSSLLSDAIVWLPRERIKATMPKQFSELYPLTVCIIDCTEVFVQRPTCLLTRAKLYSNYKAHNTIKFLVAIAPNGLIMYVSKCYGGRASDLFICTDSGFFKYLDSGDEVMADRGFGIEQQLAERGVGLNIPAFTRGRRLSELNCTKTRRIASVRIHVERVIGRMKNYSILKSILPINTMRHVDHIIHVCAALTNLQGSIITSKNVFS